MSFHGFEPGKSRSRRARDERSPTGALFHMDMDFKASILFLASCACVLAERSVFLRPLLGFLNCQEERQCELPGDCG